MTGGKFQCFPDGEGDVRPRSYAPRKMPDDLVPVFVVDGDDTLWLTEPLYDNARMQIAEVVARKGFDPLEWEALERHIDLERVHQEGLSPERFPASCVEAYERLARLQAIEPDPRLSQTIRDRARLALHNEALLAPYAEAFVGELARIGRCVLLTKGDAEIQKRRIAASGLEPRLSHVEIVPTKTQQTFRGILLMLDADAALSWSIGNSFRSDVEPALAAGMQAILLTTYSWEYEREAPSQLPDGALRAACLSDALTLVVEALARTRSEGSLPAFSPPASYSHVTD